MGEVSEFVSNQQRVCSFLASTIGTKMLKMENAKINTKIAIKMFKLTLRFYPKKIQTLLETLKKLDVDDVLVPFIKQVYELLNLNIEIVQARSTMRSLIVHCLEKLKIRLDTPTNIIKIWTIP